MRLHFLRHADALDGPDDEKRPISPKGRREAEIIGKFLKTAGVRFDAAYSSPLRRARETAAMVLDLCGRLPPGELETTAVLRNETPREDFEQWLAHLKAADHVLLVGHAPTLAERAARLLGFNHPDALSLPKAGLVCVETLAGREGRLVFFVSPEWLGAPIGARSPMTGGHGSPKKL